MPWRQHDTAAVPPRPVRTETMSPRTGHCSAGVGPSECEEGPLGMGPRALRRGPWLAAPCSEQLGPGGFCERREGGVPQTSRCPAAGEGTGVMPSGPRRKQVEPALPPPAWRQSPEGHGAASDLCFAGSPHRAQRAVGAPGQWLPRLIPRGPIDASPGSHSHKGNSLCRALGLPL